MKKCVFAGTFDPPTNGHKKAIENCLKMFDEVVVAIAVNPEKSALFTLEEREMLLNKLFAGERRVRIMTFDGAVVDLLERENTPFYVRGIRNTIDFEYENANFFASKKLKSDLVTIYLPAEQEDLHISSTLVRNSFKFKKDFSDYVPKEIYGEIKKLLKDKHVY